MKTGTVLKSSIVTAVAILIASPVFAQATAASSTTTTHHSKTSDDAAYDDAAVPQDSSTTTTTSTTASAPVVAAAPAPVIIAEQPRLNESTVRLIPALGTSSFATDREVQTDNFHGLTAALFADFGKGEGAFETGIETFASSVRSSRRTASVSVNSWGVPLLGKWNMSGKAQETVFLKGGVMPFVANGADTNNLDVMGVAGIGGNIPLGHNSALMLDASYNRLFNNDGVLTNYQGIALLGGLSINL